MVFHIFRTGMIKEFAKNKELNILFVQLITQLRFFFLSTSLLLAY